MAADQLAASGKFEERTDLTPEQLKDLPAGAVVVWNKGNVYDQAGNLRYEKNSAGKRVKMNRPHGHIAVVVGDVSSPQVDAMKRNLNPQDPQAVKLEVSDRLRDMEKMESYGTRWKASADSQGAVSHVRVFLPRG